MRLALFEENFSEGDSPVYLHILFPRQRPVTPNTPNMRVSMWFRDPTGRMNANRLILRTLLPESGMAVDSQLDPLTHAHRLRAGDAGAGDRPRGGACEPQLETALASEIGERHAR
jgi:hypothetical protein